VLAKNGAKGIGQGEPVFCSVRPECVRLKRAASAEPAAPGAAVNELAAEVQSVMYLGDSEQYSLRLADHSTVRAVEYHPSMKKARVGEKVALEFDAEAVVVLPQEDLGD